MESFFCTLPLLFLPYIRQMDLSFPKSEHLCSKIVFGKLMSDGHGFNAFPFRVIWMETDLPGDAPYQVAFSVSKRRFKKAVDRNRVKRVLRECWRLNKNEVTSHLEGKKVAFLVVYISNEKMDFKEAEPRMKKAIQKWQKHYAETIRE